MTPTSLDRQNQLSSARSASSAAFAAELQPPDPLLIRPFLAGQNRDEFDHTLERSFRHSGWAPARQAIFDSLVRTGSTARAIAAFADCGHNLWLGTRDGELCLKCDHCHSRHCVPCGVAKRAQLTARVVGRVHAAPGTLRFLTLTLRTSETPLVDQITRLQASFRRLRQRKWWAALVQGGASFLEIKLGANSKQWHVHLHVLVEGHFMDQVTLGSEWHAVTGDSYIVDVRALRATDPVASYCVKYATKPLHADVIRSPEHLDECIVATRGRRLVTTFGAWCGFEADDSADRLASFVPLFGISRLSKLCRQGDAVALEWMAKAVAKFPGLAVFLKGRQCDTS